MLPEHAVALIAAHMNQHQQGLAQQQQQAQAAAQQPGSAGPGLGGGDGAGGQAPLGITQDTQQASDLNALEGGVQ